VSYQIARDDTERLIAVLRLVAVPVLLAGEAYVPAPSPTSNAFKVVIATFAVYAAVVTIIVFRGGSRPHLPVLLACTDLLFAGLLSFTSGGGFSQLRFAFLFVPVTTAFRYRPRLTLAVSLAAIWIYVLQAVSHPSRRARGDADSFVAVNVAYLAWLGAAATLLSDLLARRERAVRSLLQARQRLVAEAMAAEERERKRLSEDLHDDAIQNLLAARHELEQRADDDPESAEARAYEAVTATIARLRSAVAELHPYLLDQAGIQAALSITGERAARRGGYELDLYVDRSDPSENDSVLLRCAGELLANAATHARARHVRVTLRTRANEDILTVDDDGQGFDVSILEQRLREGHVGVLSVRERAEALGGSFKIDTAPGRGAHFTLRLPRSRVREGAETT
jgi:two-component system NarL family sensor kinase